MEATQVGNNTLRPVLKSRKHSTCEKKKPKGTAMLSVFLFFFLLWRDTQLLYDTCNIAKGNVIPWWINFQRHTAWSASSSYYSSSTYGCRAERHCDILTLTQVEESLSIWQLSVMKKHFWTLWAFLVYLHCLWVALSSVFSPNWILCTHSHRRICIFSYTRRIYLAHTHSTFAFMCLLPLCIMTAGALPSHLFAFLLNPHPVSEASPYRSKEAPGGKYVVLSKWK